MIDFRCGQCGKLLRTPDDAAGKSAKCPACGNVQQIPAASTASAASAPAAPEPTAATPPPLPGGGGSPFASAPPAAGGGVYGDPTNPYAAPAYDPRFQAAAAGTSPIVPTRIDAMEVLNRAWTIFKQNALMIIAGYWITMVLIQITSFVLGMAVTLTANSAPQSVQILMSLIQNVGSQLLGIWLNLGLTIFMLKIGRGQAANLGDLFAGGPYFIRAVVATIIVGLAFGGVVLVAAIPALGVGVAVDPSVGLIVFAATMVILAIPLIYAALGVMQFQQLIVDRNLSPMDALRTSWAIVNGNRLALIMLGILGFLLMLLGLLMLCIGMVATVPLAMFMYYIAYLAMTGQRTAEMNLPPAPAAA